MTPLPNLFDCIKIYDNSLPLEHLSTLLQWIDKQEEFESATVGSNELKEDIRKAKCLCLTAKHGKKTLVHWHNYLTHMFLNKIKEYQKIFPELRINNYLDINILKYEKTGFYKYHTDNSTFHPRTISLIYLLNNDYKGGELCFGHPTNYEEVFHVPVVPNRLIMWPSNFLYPHSVNPVTEGVKYSIVAWGL